MSVSCILLIFTVWHWSKRHLIIYYLFVTIVKEKYNHDFFSDLHSCIKREELLRYTLGLRPRLLHDNELPKESRDEINNVGINDVGGGDGDEFPNMTFEIGDITKGLNHPDESFDLIICKKTMDIVLCGAASVSDCRKMMAECYRLLNKEHGVLLVLSSAKPEDRAVFFENDPWSGVMNIKLPSKDEERERKGHEKKKLDMYAYILYKQQQPQM